jgi:transcriptional regulator with XRE-family HTH domain
MASIKDKPISAIKFKNYCVDNGISAKQIAKILNITVKAVYCYWSGVNQVPDYAKKLLEQKLNMPIYEIFLNESFDVEAIVTYKKRGA